ncbi:MAG: PRC-barrel domain-containing protein, partial [Anaerolineae bacterium]
MKKFVVLLLIPVLVLALVACEPGEATEDVPADTEVPEDDELFEDEPADDEFTEDEGLTDDDEMLDAEAVNDALVSSVLGTRLWLRDTDEADNVETVRIEDILFDQDGTIEYIVIDTGGLFDDTRRSVAVEPDIIGFTSPEGDRQITYLAEYPDLETAPEFDVAGAGEGPTVADDVEAEFAGLLRANIYQDFVVRNNADEGVGNVENLIADFETNEIAHAIVEVGGFLDIGDTEVVVPWDSFTWDAENETFILPVSRDVIENAPVFDDTEWTNGAPGADWDAEHTAYWDDVEYEDVGAMDDDDAMANGDVTAVARASELLGTRFRLPDADATFNVDTVQVEDILFSADGAIQYVVIDTGGIFDFDSGVVAVGQERIEFTTVEGERLLT